MRLSGCATIDSISAQASVPEQRCRFLLDCWNDAGLVRVSGSGSARTAELITPRINPPVITRDGNGSVTCVSYLDESHVTVIRERPGGIRTVSTRRKPGR